MSTLTGTILEDGAPVIRTVRIYEHWLGDLIAETTSDANGFYSVEFRAGVIDVLFIGADGKQHQAHGPLTVYE